MVYLSAGLVLVALVSALNLLLTVGIIRRLRQHTALLATRADAGAPGLPAVGDPVEPFVASTVDGRTISGERLRRGALVVFLSPGCAPCEEQVPVLVRRLRQAGGDPGDTLVVIVGEPDEAARMVAELAPLATVVCEAPPATQVQTAFGVAAFPVALVVDGAIVSDVFVDLNRLPQASSQAAVPAS